MEVRLKVIKIFQSANGQLPFVKWIRALRDLRGKQKIEARIDRVRSGNLGDHRAVGEGVLELRIQYGPGYRVYFGQDGDTFVILLLGGDKSSQDEDIKKAKEYWSQYRKEKAYANG